MNRAIMHLAARATRAAAFLLDVMATCLYPFMLGPLAWSASTIYLCLKFKSLPPPEFFDVREPYLFTSILLGMALHASVVGLIVAGVDYTPLWLQYLQRQSRLRENKS